MRILFFNPPGEDTVPEIQSEEGTTYLDSSDVGAFPPLGLLYVLSYLEENTTGHEMVFLDCIGEKVSQAELPNKIREISPDVIGITSFTISLVDISRAVKTMKKIVPNAHICLGGHHPIAFPYLAAQLEGIDSIIVGEGEIAFKELVNALEEEKEFT